MKKLALFSAVLIFILVHGNSLNAGILEIRAGAGINSTDPDDFNNSFNTVSSSLKLDDLTTYNIDAFINIPLFPLGAGLRYEFASDDQAATAGAISQKWDLETKNISLLVDWRIIDLLVYLGPIISVGKPTADIEVTTNGLPAKTSLDSDGLSYSVGAEAGINLKNWIVGAEAGYKQLKYKKNSTFNVDIDLSGMYGKVMVGYSFF